MSTINAKRIIEERRLCHTANIFGDYFPLALEPVIYTFASRLSHEYCGGYWHFYELDNRGFYMVPDDDSFEIISENGFEGTMSADALGITACLFAYSHLSFSKDPELSEMYARHYHLLRDYMVEHDEVRAISAAID